MMQRRSGKIINMGSLTAYCAAFGGILAYSKSVARFAAAYNINVNTVSPGTIATPMTAAWLSTKVMLVANRKTERDSELPTSKVQARFLNSPPLPK
jgi:NAD(P)-dependent dehydrogenase (short-subunit alcohol dehydrogenase family)